MKPSFRALIVLAGILLVPLPSCRGGIGDFKEDLARVRDKKQKENKLKALGNKIPESKPYALDSASVEKFALLSLTCVDQQYPNKPADVLEAEGDVKPTIQVHPSFYGCFDWHSSVHGHWAMVRILKTFPSNPQAPLIREKLTRHLGRENIAAEAATFERSSSGTFERPYGWGWMLRLAAEVRDFKDPDATIFAKNLEPLEQVIVKKIFEYLLKLSVPVRVGTHNNTAFTLVHVWDYATTVGDDKLQVLLKKRGRDFYLKDTDCPLDYEPSGEDFISPCLAEADFMRRILSPEEFRAWFDGFLPVESTPLWESLVKPPVVLDRKDPVIGHLIGLSFQRAWSMKGIASVLTDRDVRKNLLLKSARWHEQEGLTQMSDSGYGGEHWLASFALYALTDTGL